MTMTNVMYMLLGMTIIVTASLLEERQLLLASFFGMLSVAKIAWLVVYGSRFNR